MSTRSPQQCKSIRVLNGIPTYDFLKKFTYRTTVKRRKTAVFSRHRTVVSLDFGSTVLLRDGQHPYSAVFCTALAVYGTVESPMQHAGSRLVQWLAMHLALIFPGMCHSSAGSTGYTLYNSI
jgi:hypothetical protein